MYVILFILFSICALGGCQESRTEPVELSDWHDGIENQAIMDYFKEEIEEINKVYNYKEVTIKYLEFDFNDDGKTDYLTCVSSAYHSGTKGDTNCILVSEDDGLREIPLILAFFFYKTDDNEYVYSYCKVPGEKTNGFYDVILYDYSTNQEVLLQYNGDRYLIDEIQNIK